MKKWIFSMALSLSLSAGTTDSQLMLQHDHIEEIRAFSSHESQYLIPESVQTGSLAVKAMKIDGFTGESLVKLNRAFEVLEAVVNSDEFKNRVINFKNSKGERSFASNKGLTNEEIYEHIMEGKEDLQPNTQGEMNFYLKLYHKPFSRVIGYTSPTTNLININWKFFKNYAPHQVASNLLHEWLHKMGYGHRSAKEHDSVPYALGYILGELAQKNSQKTVELH